MVVVGVGLLGVVESRSAIVGGGGSWDGSLSTPETTERQELDDR